VSDDDDDDDDDDDTPFDTALLSEDGVFRRKSFAILPY